ncbi:MAG: hypothetical protein CVT72_09735 [Alphaproteobacteria bacterium HGW-Alphaproteobacteria-11]|nr:MAG: hypothetical protein CVT72_09735 [Alphaproteobacteria bacterium HGW-Alphaproteobacteria-11]
MNTYLNREAATALLAAHGFNRTDIECVLDLTKSVSQSGAPVWPSRSVERLASRAWWLDGAEIKTSMPQAA